MKNVNLNPGGIIGGLLAAGLCAGGMFAWDGAASRRVGRVVVFAAFAGGVAGNWLWGFIYPESCKDTHRIAA